MRFFMLILWIASDINQTTPILLNRTTEHHSCMPFFLYFIPISFIVWIYIYIIYTLTSNYHSIIYCHWPHAQERGGLIDIRVQV